MSNINCGIWVLHVKRQILTIVFDVISLSKYLTCTEITDLSQYCSGVPNLNWHLGNKLFYSLSVVSGVYDKVLQIIGPCSRPGLPSGWGAGPTIYFVEGITGWRGEGSVARLVVRRGDGLLLVRLIIGVRLGVLCLAVGFIFVVALGGDGFLELGSLRHLPLWWESHCFHQSLLFI